MHVYSGLQRQNNIALPSCCNHSLENKTEENKQTKSKIVFQNAFGENICNYFIYSKMCIIFLILLLCFVKILKTTNPYPFLCWNSPLSIITVIIKKSLVWITASTTYIFSQFLHCLVAYQFKTHPDFQQ